MTSLPRPHPGLEERLAVLRRRATHSAQNPNVREAVRMRAGDACEYCLLPTIGRFHVDSESEYLFIVGATEVGRITAGPHGLHFNAGEPEGPLGTRHIAILRGDYPPGWARAAYGI